jgi:hypothetical protein
VEPSREPPSSDLRAPCVAARGRLFSHGGEKGVLTDHGFGRYPFRAIIRLITCAV